MSVTYPTGTGNLRLATDLHNKILPHMLEGPLNNMFLLQRRRFMADHLHLYQPLHCSPVRDSLFFHSVPFVCGNTADGRWIDIKAALNMRAHTGGVWIIGCCTPEHTPSPMFRSPVGRLCCTKRDQCSSTHLSFGFVFLVLFGSAARSFGPDVASSISEEGTAFIPLWILPHTQREGNTRGIR